MSARKDLITKEMFEQYKKEQQLLVKKLSNKVETQNKKNKRSFLYVLLFCLLFSCITSVASYSIGANSVGYTPADSGWFVDNTQEAIDDLFESVGASLVGSIYSYMGVNVPSGYLACNGATYNIADYPRLANHIKSNFGKYNYFGGDGTTTFAVPDLRGEFLRGSGTNGKTYYAGLAVGSHQDPTYVPRVIADQDRLEYISANTGNDGKGDARNADGTFNSTTTRQYRLQNTSSIWESSTNSTTHYSVRPTNTSVLYIIKY